MYTGYSSHMDKPITTIRQFGNYSVIGKTKLALKLSESREVAEFTHEGFKFGQKTHYSTLYRGDIKGKKDLLVRISSNCQWSFYFDNQFCDCRWQLEKAKQLIVEEGVGLIIFAHDEHGKGIGLEDHWKIYAEGQARGRDLVVDIYQELGYREDYREYDDIVEILKYYRLTDIRLLTNSSKRIEALEKQGLKIKRIRCEAPLNPHLQAEYRAKKDKLGHNLDLN